MKRFLQQAAVLLSSFVILHSSIAADPLRVFIRAGKKSHAPGAHDFPQFLKDWVPMLNERGAKADGGMEFPTKEQLDKTDVLILHAQEAGNIKIGEERKNLMEFLKRGGGLVVIHAAAVSRDHDWYKNIIGGSWNFSRTKWLEAPMSLYFTDRENPITRDISNFDLDDEIYYDMDMLPEAKVLAAAYTPNAKDTGGKGNKEAQERAAEAVAKHKGVNIYDIQPQMWTYEKDNYRAFTCIPGHWYKNFSHDGVRTAILRGIAWAGKRENIDELCKPEELGDALRYADGGAPRPQDLLKQLEVHPDFDISLVGSEPLINNPMNINWDEKGRLWVVETPEYPNGLRQANVESWMDSGSVKPGQYQRDPMDRVSILTDTDGDGIMDKKQVFADKIELATSSVFYKKGVIVSAAPDIWYFEDTDGDDKADKRTKIYTNLGIRDTHAVINNMRWGLDGWIYATHGYSSSDNVTSGDGSKSFGPIGAGVVRFKPDGSAIEQYASRGGNTWGLDITSDGQVFYTQPTSGNHFIHVVLPEYVLAKGKLPGVVGTNGMLPHEPTYPAMHWEKQAYVQIDQVGSYTAAAGCAIYEGGAWPEKWNYSYFTTEPTLNIVSQFMVEPDGVTYKAHREAGREQTEFIRSTNLWFRPIEVRVGPDGALYVVDFCNQAVIHNDTRGPTHGPANAAVRPDRDHYYGRIWKVQHKQAKKIEVVKLDKDNPEALKSVLSLDAPAHIKKQARRLLIETH
ncbi:MAG: ThuA domain-containing protein, partial [Prosthecobacter sp.]|nr:ThuA domain-containing protein [Prosthecobacter sp.]